MLSPDLPTLERRLEACLLELERLYEARPRMSDALARAGAGQRIDDLVEEIAELQQEIMLSPAETDLDPAAIAWQRELERRHYATAGSRTGSRSSR